MFKHFRPLLAGLVLCSVFPSYAQAEQFFFEHRKERFTITFPDSWRRVTNQKADDRLTIAGPGTGEYATCKVRTRQDRRFVIFPQKFDSDIQRIAYSRDFWNGYLGDYDKVVVDIFRDASGLGRGYASMVEASYETAEGPLVRKRGMMFATLHHDQAYIVDCSAEETVFSKWRPVFLSIIKSADFADLRHVEPHGHYRAFDEDPKLDVEGKRKLDVYTF